MIQQLNNLSKCNDMCEEKAVKCSTVNQTQIKAEFK